MVNTVTISIDEYEGLKKRAEENHSSLKENELVLIENYYYGGRYEKISITSSDDVLNVIAKEHDALKETEKDLETAIEVLRTITLTNFFRFLNLKKFIKHKLYVPHGRYVERLKRIGEDLNKS